MAQGIFWNELFVKQRADASRFYCELLGWDTIEVADGCSVFTAKGHHVASIRAGMGNHGWIPHFEVDDIERARTTVLALGGKVISNVHPVQGVGALILVEDPEGSRSMLVGPAQT